MRATSLIALVVAVLCVWALEARRAGVEITDLSAGPTPVVRYQMPGSDGPAVVVAHGFAGSLQMMQAYSLTIARAGYRVYAFDFEGHGRNPVPMSGDVNAIEGTTRLLINQTRDVIGFAASDSGWEGPVGLVGHSMATDVIIRTALETPQTEPIVAISAFSQAVTPDAPDQLLLIPGQWEPGLRDFAVSALGQVVPKAALGMTANGLVTRRAVVAPYVEHVAILHSRVAQTETVAWLHRAYGGTGYVPVPPTGWYLVALLAALVVLGVRGLSRLPSARQDNLRPVTGWPFWALAIAIPLLVPLVATQVDTAFMPVLVADYLALHLLLIGVCQLILLWRVGVRFGSLSVLGLAVLAGWAIAVFGLALHRYGANFVPIAERVWIIAALLPGAAVFMLADRRLCHAAPFWRRAIVRVGFFCSLILAIVLDPERLFFLTMIAPVIALFYFAFGSMGRALDTRSGPLAPGFAMGLVLAWSLGVSFPMFAAGG